MPSSEASQEVISDKTFVQKNALMKIEGQLKTPLFDDVLELLKNEGDFLLIELLHVDKHHRKNSYSSILYRYHLET